jgi:licheninase
LTRGYNITNWLEQKRFVDFSTYNEDFVKQLAAAGFKSLRLPIDLDLYIDSTTGTGDSLDVVVNSDLFTILDSFDTWTKSAGISLTVDYHQYDQSLKMADPDSLTKAVKLWGKVAEHFATSTREDLFFELLNEPDLSFGGTAPTQTEWTTLAERMITAIRASDTTHTILFGDVQWYSIDTLKKRTVLSDSNVIYVFHDYDPFIFTHQGATWANMASTHDLPYPYSADRWSQFYSDLGFSPFMDAWILSAAKSYYATGNRSALRNHVLLAKSWAVKNNVPVICNEFGAYDGSSRLEDRARYYTDIVSVFDELQIPWQEWFMIMDSTGTVIPEYRAALKLGQ